MLDVIFTLDYEIHGNGEGCSHDLMVEPTGRILDLFDKYGAKLTIMADVAEILKFKEYRDNFGRDDYNYEAIVAQLRDAIKRGHDVQLHLHCSYFNARFENGKWIQDWTEYNFAGLSEDRLNEVLRIGNKFLEDKLRSVDPTYRCYVFRAANWAVSPSRYVVRALINNGFEIDTSVFKYGRRDGLVNFDYSDAPSNLVPWLVHENDICQEDDAGTLLEVPIYCEDRWIGAFASANRIYRVLSSRACIPGNKNQNSHGISFRLSEEPKRKKLSILTQRHAWKADFTQCTGHQLSRALERAARTSNPESRGRLPLVLIGHSKLFTSYNERNLEPFLRYVEQRPAQFSFGKFRGRHLDPSWKVRPESVSAPNSYDAARNSLLPDARAI